MEMLVLKLGFAALSFIDLAYGIPSHKRSESPIVTIKNGTYYGKYL